MRRSKMMLRRILPASTTNRYQPRIVSTRNNRSERFVVPAAASLSSSLTSSIVGKRTRSFGGSAQHHAVTRRCRSLLLAHRNTSTYSFSCRASSFLDSKFGQRTSYHHLRITRRNLQWVPLAYRGAAREEKKRHDDNNDYGRRPRRRKGGRSSSPPNTSSKQREGRRATTKDRSIAATNKNRDRELAAAAAAKTAATRKTSLEINLHGLHQELIRLAEQYRANFSSSSSSIPVTEGGGLSTQKPSSSMVDVSSSNGSSNGDEERPQLQQQDGLEYHDEIAKKKAMIRSMARKVRTTFQDIHADTDIVVTMQHVNDTEDAFKGLCRGLQNTIKTATELQKLNYNTIVKEDNEYDNKNNDGSSSELIDLAEAALASLVKVRSDRALLVESARTWAATNKAYVVDPPGSADGCVRVSGSSKTISPWMSFVRSLLLSPPDHDEDINNDNDSPDDDRNMVMAHEDPILGVTQALFATVMDPLAEQAALSQKNNGQQEQQQRISRRMIALLDAMPSSWIPDEEVVKQVLESLCRIGSLDSARLCFAAYRRHPNIHQRLRFSLVLQAYLEACRNESVESTTTTISNSNEVENHDESKVLLAAQEVLDALHSEWDVNLPKHRVERIVHSSLVLNCLCVAERRGVHVPRLHKQSVNAVKRAIGFGAYRILQDPKLWNNSKSGDIFPLVNCLAQVYTVGESPNFEKARHLLAYLMQHDRQGVGRFMVHPMVDTFNAVLLSLVLDYEGKSEKNKSTDEEAEDKTTECSEQDVEKSLDYATTLLDYMLSGREATFWPNDETFSYMFRLLVATKPKDIGQRAQQILSKMEIRRAISSLSGDYENNNTNDPFKVSSSIYHRVLRCWLEAAKNEEITENKAACAQSALKILDKLEVQSIPLLMNDRETQISSLPTLYDIQLRPTHRTYVLVNQICLRAIKHDEKAMDVAFAVYDKLSKRGMARARDFDLLKKCVDQLPTGVKKAVAQARLQSIKDDGNDEMIEEPVGLASA